MDDRVTMAAGIHPAKFPALVGEALGKAGEEDQRRHDRGLRMGPGFPRREVVACAHALGLLSITVPR